MSELADKAPGRTTVVQKKGDHHQVRLELKSALLQNVQLLGKTDVADPGVDRLHFETGPGDSQAALQPADKSELVLQVVGQGDRVAQDQDPIHLSLIHI